MEDAVERAPLARWKKWLFIILAAFIVLTIIALFMLNAYLSRSVAQVEGQIFVPDVKEEVTVRTDDQGVPHIYANNTYDLYFAQGYVQAQNRLFQMEMSRRQASGTLSEIVGEAAIDTDKFFRTLGLRRAAEKSYNVYSEEGKEVLQAFSDGVNAFIEHATERNRLPMEFSLMEIESVEEWTPVDSLTIGKYMAYDLGGHWERQAFHYYLLQQFEEEKALELFPAYPDDKPTIIQEGEIDIAASFEKAVIPHPFNGSNNWVIGGEKTKSGKPLLANDPHLGLATPSMWYQMHLKGPDVNVSGVIFAGVPGITLGHNEEIAWGVTNTGPDVQQLYIERRNPDNPYEFLYEGEWEEAEVYEETIEVKDGEAISYEVVETRHGPIISEFASDSMEEEVMSLRWTALDATTELEAIIDINKASNWQEFEEGLEKFLAPAQNFVFMSKDGTIAYKANGKIPIYEDGKDALLPLEGWESENEWDGFIPFDELPTVVNPEKGYIASANNKVVGDDYPYHISNVWGAPYRYERIVELLEENNEFTVNDMVTIQMDDHNLQAREFVPLLLDWLPEEGLNEIEKEAVSLLESWDFHDDVNAPQPLIYHRWLHAIEDIVFAEEIPDEVMNLVGKRGQLLDALIRKGEASNWMEERGGWSEVLSESFTKTITALVNEYGEKVERWKWGDFHKVYFEHPLSDQHPVLKFLFNRDDPLGVGGSENTIMAASYDAETGIVNHGASWRFIMDGADFSNGYHHVSPGQSGHFWSDWYHDQLIDWGSGDYHVTNIEHPTGFELTFVPLDKGYQR